VLGTNSKSLKFCRLPKGLVNDEEYDQEEQSETEVIFEQVNHHDGSIYCIDWSKHSRLIATGSNDKLIKLLVHPNKVDNNSQEGNFF